MTAALVVTTLTLAAGVRPGPTVPARASAPRGQGQGKEKETGSDAKPGAGRATPRKEPVPKQPPPPDEPPPADGGPIAFVYTADEAIRFFEARVKANPGDFHSYRYLGEMHERKARESGNLAEYERAEVALRKALELFPNYPRARASLAAVLCSRHKFAEGLGLARALVRDKPTDVDALSTLGDALQELGRYPEAEEIYQKLYKLAPIPEVLARLANLDELKGKAEEARARMTRASEEAKASGGAKAAAWYQSRLGEMAFEAGRLDEAEAFYRSVPPGVDAYHDATAGLARIRAAQGRTDEAIELYKKAVAIGPDPHMLAALGDLYTRSGKPELARPLFDRLVKDASGSPEHRRNLAMFYADHDRELPRALELVRQDIAERQDVHGHDALAWVLYKNDRPEEAARAAAEALKLGTRDAKLYYHAGMIHRKLGDRAKAREYLARALAINPCFSPSGAEEARRALEALNGEGVR
jgi:tetratricopeptide (TPR) repeat protein